MHGSKPKLESLTEIELDAFSFMDTEQQNEAADYDIDEISDGLIADMVRMTDELDAGIDLAIVIYALLATLDHALCSIPDVKHRSVAYNRAASWMDSRSVDMHNETDVPEFDGDKFDQHTADLSRQLISTVARFVGAKSDLQKRDIEAVSLVCRSLCTVAGSFIKSANPKSHPLLFECCLRSIADKCGVEVMIGERNDG